MMVGLCLSSQLGLAQDEPARKKTSDWQHGEPIVSVEKAAVDAPLHRADGLPWLRLSDLKKVSLGGNKAELQLDYKVVEGMPQEVVVVFKSLQGRKTRRWSIAGDKEATIRFADLWSTVPERMEAWIETGGGILNPSDTVAGFKISNSVMLGEKGAITAARKWKPEEEQAWKKIQLTKVAPQECPEGYVFATGQRLRPGMPVLRFVAGEWSEGEYLGGYRRELVVMPPGAKPEAMHTMLTLPSRTAVAKRVLEQAEKAPESFKPSVRLLPDSLLPLTDDLQPLPDGLKLQPGTPLWYGIGMTWLPVYVVSVVGEQIEVRDSQQVRHTRKYPAATLAIEKVVIEELKKPNAEAAFVGKYAELNKKWADERRASAHVRDYPGTFPLPADHHPLEEQRPVKTGEKFLIFWSTSWQTATAFSDAPPNGAVEIEWDKHRNWVEFVSRRSLFAPDGKDQPAAEKPALTGITKKVGGGYSLTLESIQGKKFAVVKVVMDITGLDLADAKDAVEEAPILLSQSLTKETAEQFQKQLATAGAKATVRKIE